MRSILVSILISAVVGCGGGSNSDDQPAVQCSDGIDNDEDGAIDFPDDMGCTSETDETEDSPAEPQCNDGRDNDDDGLIDYPSDPGCFAKNQDDEIDDCPSGPNCPECGNEKDDDMNGSTDYPDDPGCTAASDNIEVVNNPVACGAGLMIHQLPTNGMADGSFDGTSQSMVMSPCGGGNSTSAVAYQIYLNKPKVVVVSTENAATTADTVIDVRKSECTPMAAEVACNDDAPGLTGVSKVVASLTPGNYYVILSAKNTNNGADYSMTVKLFAGEGETCAMDTECGPGLVCRTPLGGSAKSCQQPMCKDGVDDDGDGKNDYPMDPGCTTPDDNNEMDTCPGAGPNCPECGDGVDNDTDNATDYPMDNTCQAAGDPSESCLSTDGVTSITTGMTTDTTVGAVNDVRPSCATSSTTFPHTSPDQTYRIDVPALSVLDIALTGAPWDWVHAVYNSSCTGTNLECEDFDAIHMTNVAAGTYYYVVDGYSTATGPYTISLSGKIQNGASCEGPLAASGALTCGPGYACKGNTGSRVCGPALCGDGMDNDGDGKTDYPFDPGCDSIADDTEQNPGTLPVCSDGMDNDTDTQVDWPADYGCSAASGTSEAFCTTETNPTALITAKVTSGTTVGLTNNFASTSCQGSASGPDKVYALSLPVPVQTLVLDTENASFDTIITVRDAQCAMEVGCDDDSAVSGNQSKLTMSNVLPGNYAVAIDGWSGQAGTYNLTIQGTVAPQTACSSPLFSGATPMLSCPTGTTCTGTPAKCQ